MNGATIEAVKACACICPIHGREKRCPACLGASARRNPTAAQSEASRINGKMGGRPKAKKRRRRVLRPVSA